MMRRSRKASFLCDLRKNGKRNSFVALVIKFKSNFITGKFETKAQI